MDRVLAQRKGTRRTASASARPTDDDDMAAYESQELLVEDQWFESMLINGPLLPEFNFDAFIYTAVARKSRCVLGIHISTETRWRSGIALQLTVCQSFELSVT